MDLFDDDAFLRRLFFPRTDTAACAGAVDAFVDVDGARLHVRHHGSSSSTAARVLVFHGNGEVVCDYDALAPRFAAAGAALSVVDFRGYGASTGMPTLRDLVDDVAAVVVHARALARREGVAFVVLGRSLGSLCASEAIGADLDVDGVVVDSGIARVAGLVERRGLSAQALAGVDVAFVDPLPKVRRNHRPLLVIHGADDDVIDVDEGHALAAAGGVSCVVVDGHGHNDLFAAPAYWDALRRFCASLHGA